MARSGERRHLVTLRNPGAAVPDGDGGYTQTYTAPTPAQVWARITPATTRDLERLAAGTVIASASHIVDMPFHAGVTTQTQIVFNNRTFYVTGVSNPEEKNVQTIAICQEVVA